MVVLNALFLMSFRHLVFIVRDGKLLFIILYNAQYGIKLICLYAKCSILVRLQDAMFDSFFAFYIVNSPTKRVRSAVVFTRRVLDLKFVLSEEF